MKFFGYFKDGAIVQRSRPVLVRGRADGEVTCSLIGGKYKERRTVSSEAGKFSVFFPPVEDTESEFLLFAECSGKRISARLRFGDVYLALGQSNMNYCLSAAEDYEKWLKRTKDCRISLLKLEEKPVPEGTQLSFLRPALPQEELALDYDWVGSGEERLKNISAICVQTATLLSESERIPVGFVDTSMGGLSVEAYIPGGIVEEDNELVEFLKRVGRYATTENYNTSGGRNFTQLSGVWNEKIAPLVGIEFKGILWYLGESSAFDFEFGQFFHREMLLVMREFKKAFGDIPFVAAHIAPEFYHYGDGFGYLYINEALSLLEKNGATVLPIYDVEPRWLKADGDKYFHPIHPVNKAPVSERFALALAGKRRKYPQIARVDYRKGGAVCFVESDAPLNWGDIEGFTLAGENGKYYPAKARITGERKITVTCPDVEEPKNLTYAFMQYQDFCNAKSADGAPLLPYRSKIEPVNENYCFPPAYTVNGALKVYENCFGWQAGSCRKAAVWKNGGIYDGAPALVSGEEDCVAFSAAPTAEEYFFFGTSPAICLSGHKNHIADYNFWNFELKAEGKVDFYGVCFRTADGLVSRFDLMNGEETTDFLPLDEEFSPYAVRLTSGMAEDSAPAKFSREFRKNIVEAEFLFRAEDPVKVCLKDLVLSDKNLSALREKREKSEEARLDVKLPERADK